MIKITEIEKYTDLLNVYQKRIPNMIYNHMMLPGEAVSHIEKGRFYYGEQDEGIVFLVKEKDFYKLYFYISETAEIHVPETDRPRLLEYIYAEERKISVLRRCGGKQRCQASVLTLGTEGIER